MNKSYLIIFVFLLLMAGLGVYFLLKTDSQSLNSSESIPLQEGDVIITFQHLNLSQSIVRVPVGTTVTWQNKDTAPHRLKFEDFYSGILEPGQSFKHTFNKKGTFLYICEFHTYIKGKVIVE